MQALGMGCKFVAVRPQISEACFPLPVFPPFGSSLVRSCSYSHLLDLESLSSIFQGISPPFCWVRDG